MLMSDKLAALIERMPAQMRKTLEIEGQKSARIHSCYRCAHAEWSSAQKDSEGILLGKKTIYTEYFFLLMQCRAGLALASAEGGGLVLPTAVEYLCGSEGQVSGL